MVTCSPTFGIVPEKVAVKGVTVLGCITAGFGLRSNPVAVNVVTPNGIETESSVSGVGPVFTNLIFSTLVSCERVTWVIFIAGA